jgi:hypothetical protein
LLKAIAFAVSYTQSLEIVLALFDFLSTCAQLALLSKVATKHKDILEILIIFNPCSVFGGGI